MGRKANGANVRAYQRARVAAREELERRFGPRVEIDVAFETLVTNEGGRDEPFHRWHPYRQAFSPGLVRRFLEEATPADGPILDPFSGSGTTVVECARRGRAAVGVDAVPVLAWLARARFAREAPPLPPVPNGETFAAWYAAARGDAQRAAVLLAAGRTVSGSGRPKKAESPQALIEDLYPMIAEDVHEPLPDVGRTLVGDARALPLRTESCGGMVTSPPYLSRYDYARINAPMETLFNGGGRAGLVKRQLRAAVGVRGRELRRPNRTPLPAAAEEAAAGLEARGNRADAAVVRNYFADLLRVLRECRRVLRPDAPCWIVIAGADLDREYVPADLVCVEAALALGFELEGITEARKIRWSLRRLGLLQDVAPRESILRLRRGADASDDDV